VPAALVARRWCLLLPLLLPLMVLLLLPCGLPPERCSAAAQ
jgi:hypothetical protein